MALHQDYEAINYLQSVDMTLISTLREQIGGDDLLWFVSKEYAAHCRATYDTLHIQKPTLQNDWIIFSHMLLRM